MQRRSNYFFDAKRRFSDSSVFIKRHAALHGMTYEESYEAVMKTMITLQDMLCTEPYFMLPGIGTVGIARGKNKMLRVSSSYFWWAPGLLTVMNAAPGWENAPLNSYLTDKHLQFIAKLHKRTKADKPDLLTFTETQFKHNSDRTMDYPTSSDKIAYVQATAETPIIRKAKWILGTVLDINKELKRHVKELQEEIRRLKGDTL